MRIIVLFVFAIMIFGCESPAEDKEVIDSEWNLVPKVIEIILDNVKRSELKNKNFGVICTSCVQPSLWPDSLQPRIFLAWFSYSPKDKYIMVNYVSFPKISNFESFPIDEQSENEVIDSFLAKIIQNKQIMDTNCIKQYKVLTPLGIRSNDLIKKILKLRKKTIEMPLELRSFIDDYFYYFGFKDKNNKMINLSFNLRVYSDDNLLKKIYEQIIYPLMLDIYFNETPMEWRKAYMEGYKEKYGIYPVEYNPETFEVNYEVLVKMRNGVDYEQIQKEFYGDDYDALMEKSREHYKIWYEKDYWERKKKELSPEDYKAYRIRNGHKD